MSKKKKGTKPRQRGAPGTQSAPSGNDGPPSPDASAQVSGAAKAPWWSRLKPIARIASIVIAIAGVIGFGATLLSNYPLLEDKGLVPAIPATPRFHFETVAVYRVVSDDAVPGRLNRAYYGVLIDLANRATSSTFIVDGLKFLPRAISIAPRGGLISRVVVYDEAPRLHSPYNVTAGGARTRLAFMLPVQSESMGAGDNYGSYANLEGDLILVVDGREVPVVARYLDRGVIRMAEWDALATDPFAPLSVLDHETTRSNPWPDAQR